MVWQGSIIAVDWGTTNRRAWRTGIVPGVAQQRRDAPDVMRGEEVQIIGALASGLVSGDAMLCLRGTHSKWVQLINGRIASFATWMTGELLALIARDSVLAPLLQGRAAFGRHFAAFRLGCIPRCRGGRFGAGRGQCACGFVAGLGGGA